MHGRIEGRIGVPNRLVLEEDGSLEADLDVAEAQLKGAVKGEVVASKTAVLHPSARVVGSIRAPRVVIEEGAQFTGTIEMDVELPADVKVGNA